MDKLLKDSEETCHDHREIFAQVDSQSLWLTANRRLVIYWRQAYLRWQKIKKMLVWETLPILSLDSWLTSLWQEQLEDHRILLSPFQTQMVWEEMIQKEDQQLLQVSSTAQLMQQAWNRLNLWGVSIEQLSPVNEEIAFFLRCVKQFSIQCQTKNWVTSSQLPQLLNDLVQKNNLSLPKHIYLAGFVDNLPPAVQALLKICQKKSNIVFVQLPEKKSIIARVEAENARDECYQMANWAKEQLKQNSSARIACVLPNLSDISEQVRVIFKEVLSPDRVNISAGMSLMQYSPVKTAFHLLCLYQEPIEFNFLSHLLRSPYWNTPEEAAIIDLTLRKLNVWQLSRRQFLKVIEKAMPKGELLPRFRRYLNRLKTLKENYTLSEWAKLFVDLLNILGWPFKALIESEKQICERFEKCLIEFAQLNPVLQAVDFVVALQLLKKLLKQTVFQPASKGDEPIQVLGLLEAVGQSFDCLWMAGLDDQTWPGPAAPNPFIAHHLQKQLNMPHASSDHELIYAKKLQHYFFTHAEKIVISHAKLKEDVVVQASPLIRDIPLKTLKEKIDPIELLLVGTIPLEKVANDEAPPVQANEKNRGGTSILKDQACCPFRAFAHFRLQAKSLDSPEISLSPLERGQWVHQALERLWRKFKTQANLLNLSEENLAKEILSAIYLSKQNLFADMMLDVTQRTFIALEEKRLQKILLDWLKLEKKRPPFKVILLEHFQRMKVGPLDLSVRMDRVDELEDGSHLVIDYKTGRTHTSDWFSRNLRAPQLPLYCVFGLMEIQAIAFASVSAKDLGFKGVATKDYGIEGIKTVEKTRQVEETSWMGILNYWQSALLQLAESFYQGEVSVYPVDDEACLYCDLHALCRMKSRT